jgi:UDP-galactopyranose mutase
MVLDSIDVVVIGAGAAGITAARQAAERGKRVLVIEKRSHIGGHCYDRLDENGIYIHQYGPHIFHTKNRRVWDFLSRFTEWHYYRHKVLGLIDGRLVPIPFNLNSLEALFPKSRQPGLERKLIDTFGFGSRVPIRKFRASEDAELKELAEFIYEKVFLHYTAKQWGVDPEAVDPSVSDRVPVVLSRDDHYFADPFQGIPRPGYTAMFSAMADHPSIHLLLNCDGRDLIRLEAGTIFLEGRPFSGEVIYTGAADELFASCEGPLPYRSLDISFEAMDVDRYQEAAVVNYPNNYDFTRITEFKQFQLSPPAGKTVVCREYPCGYEKGRNNPYYVIKNGDTEALFGRYKALADGYSNLHLLGRLAEYRYYDMDKVMESAIDLVSGLFVQ